MKPLYFVMSLGMLLISHSVYALSPEAQAGKSLFAVCLACHDTAQDPPKGPPMWGVKRRYKRNSLDDEDFIKSMVEFVSKPSEDKAIHDMALEQMGLMPAMPLGDTTLTQIARYILEEEFPPPCDHWTIAVKRAKARGDEAHAAKDQRQLDRFCN